MFHQRFDDFGGSVANNHIILPDTEVFFAMTSVFTPMPEGYSRRKHIKIKPVVLHTFFVVENKGFTK